MDGGCHVFGETLYEQRAAWKSKAELQALQLRFNSKKNSSSSTRVGQICVHWLFLLQGSLWDKLLPFSIFATLLKSVEQLTRN